MLNLRLASLQLAVVFLVRRKQCFPAFPQIFPAFLLMFSFICSAVMGLSERPSLLFPRKKLAYLLKHGYLYCSRWHLALSKMVCCTVRDGILSSKAKGVPALKVISFKCHVPMLLVLRSIVPFLHCYESVSPSDLY